MNTASKAVTGRSVLAATILFKGVLLAAWLGSLVLIRRMIACQAPIDRCLAIAVAGWMPLGLLQSVAEGHNDIFMVWLSLWWQTGCMTARLAAASRRCSSLLTPR